MSIQHFPSSIELLSRLVSFDTVSSSSNLALIEWVANHLQGLGVQSHLTYDGEHNKANLFATIGPQDEGGVCLHGHTDVVPVTGQPWQSDPFSLTERGGRLHGRGTCDMKAWLACALAAVPALKAKRLRTPVHLALSFDEEVGCLGAPTMIESFGRAVPKPRVAIVGEPSLMAPINAHKGMLALETTITGRAAHSSLLHLGVSAVSAAAEMAVELHRIAREWMDLDGPSGMKPSGPTASVGVLQGGVARNIVAREASLQWEIRFRAKDDLQHLLQFAMDRIKLRLQRRFGADYEALQIATRELATIPAFDAGQGGLAELLVQRLGAAGVASAVPYGAEAGQYANAGISTVICGPGSIEQAHQPDEYISISQVRSCDEFMARLSEWASEVHLSSNADALAGA